MSPSTSPSPRGASAWESGPQSDADSVAATKAGHDAAAAKTSKRGLVRKLFKSPAVARYEEHVTAPRKDWGTGNQFGGGPYRPLMATQGVAAYLTASAAAGKR